MAGCPTTIVPILLEDECKGVQTSSNCVIHSLGITYLGLPPNSTLTEVLAAYLLSLVDARNTILLMQTQLADLEQRVLDLETP